MSAIGGTYDFLYVPFLLPTSVVTTLLPNGSRPLSVPANVLSILADPKQTTTEPQHLVALELGYQKGTGPLVLPFGMDFHETKLEIPYVSHPALPPTSETPFLLKQTIVFSNALLSFSSGLLAGLKSAQTTFTPKGSTSPRDIPADSADPILYGAQNYLNTTFSPVSASPGAAVEKEADQATLETLTALLHAEWFGVRTGKTIQRFEYARLASTLPQTAINKTAEITPRKYVSELGTIQLGGFQGQVVVPGKEGTTIEVPKGTKAWRIRARYRSFSRKL
ncbi:hypothetical protein V8E36_008936 [Tilletia maclaganii]